MAIKTRQVRDMELRTQKSADKLDTFRYKVQEGQKDITELKLKIDVLKSTNDGLISEKKHLLLELSETKELMNIYEKKTNQLMAELQNTTGELQENKREMIGFSEVSKEREDKIAFLKEEVSTLKNSNDDLDVKYGTLKINHEKLVETKNSIKVDYDDVVEKLHQMNKARHELETKLSDEIERNRSLAEVVRLKEDTLQKRSVEIEEQDKKIIDLERNFESVEIKKNSIERAFELAKKQLNEKITNLNEVITSEKENRDMWIERYEKEQRDHTNTNAQLL